ncbi:MAG: hypothetical protein CMR00_10940 [[Chlorobium] sp. 445]|nr:MAG: hypothetical protein CMR00_10940 [[Chlorobium] sp. 445]
MHRRIMLFQIAHGRSGDKGDTANVGIIARRPEFYEILKNELTPEVVKAHFGDMVKGNVERYEMPNIGALNFLLHESLGGGGTKSLKLDAQGKTYAAALLRLFLTLDDERYPQLKFLLETASS